MSKFGWYKYGRIYICKEERRGSAKMERVIDDCKIRKRGCSSSSSSSSALLRKQRPTKKKLGMDANYSHAEEEEEDVVASIYDLAVQSKSKSHSRSASSDPSLVSQRIDHRHHPPRDQGRQRFNNNMAAAVEIEGPRLQDLRNGLVTSKELLKVLHRVWQLRDQPQDRHSSTGSNIMSALKLELHRLRSHVDQIILHQRSQRDEMLQQFAQEKAVWRSKERDRIRDAISVIASELEVEKKLRKQTERLNKKLGKELSDTKGLVETERRAKDVLEQVCDELVKGIAEDRAKVEEMKRETAKVIEQVEKEREMLQVAHVLREERLQMTLSEAKYHFQEKNAAVDKLRVKLQGYLTNKLDHEVYDDEDDDVDEEDESRKIQELRMVLRKSGIEESKVEEGGDSESDDDWGGESDMHCIELNKVVDSGRSSAEMMFKGRKSLSDKVQWGSICFNKQVAGGGGKHPSKLSY